MATTFTINGQPYTGNNVLMSLIDPFVFFLVSQ